MKKYLLTAFTLLATCNSIIAMDQTPKHALCDILPLYKTPFEIDLEGHNQDATDDSQVIPHYALKGHTDTVWKVTTEYDDTTNTTFAISASADTTIKIWNLEEKKCVKTWHGHTASVNTVKKVMIDEDFFIASGSDDTIIRLWRMSDNECYKTLKGHTAPILALEYLGNNQLASGDRNGKIRIWNLNTFECIQTFELADSLPVLQLASLPDGNLAAGCTWGRIYIIDMQSNDIKTLIAGTDYVGALLAFGQNYLISGALNAWGKGLGIIWNWRASSKLQNFSIGSLLDAIEPFELNKIIMGSFMNLAVYNYETKKFEWDKQALTLNEILCISSISVCNGKIVYSGVAGLCDADHNIYVANIADVRGSEAINTTHVPDNPGTTCDCTLF